MCFRKLLFIDRQEVVIDRSLYHSMASHDLPGEYVSSMRHLRHVETIIAVVLISSYPPVSLCWGQEHCLGQTVCPSLISGAILNEYTENKAHPLAVSRS